MTHKRRWREFSMLPALCSAPVCEAVILEITNVNCRVKSFPNLELFLTS